MFDSVEDVQVWVRIRSLLVKKQRLGSGLGLVRSAWVLSSSARIGWVGHTLIGHRWVIFGWTQRINLAVVSS